MRVIVYLLCFVHLWMCVSPPFFLYLCISFVVAVLLERVGVVNLNVSPPELSKNKEFRFRVSYDVDKTFV